MCEGRYRVVYTYDCFLLFHLRCGRLLNMPFYLLITLLNMAHYVRMSQKPLSFVTNHGLIKFLVLTALSHGNKTWEQFIAGARVNWGPAVEVRVIEEGDDKKHSESVGGRDSTS